ncbi:uncharacterized protein [Rutidosis leptorrhynchoides]|uniref:uncharacterized protein n=1 Tax=Rutidosis leptorrhynchoides TaxID=125765 RepID=UPI003A995292
MAIPTGDTINGAATANGGQSAVPENSAVAHSQHALLHRINLTAKWTRDEQSLFEKLLKEYASEKRVVQFAKIARQLNDKTIRDVALRFRWMLNNKLPDDKRKKDDSNSSRKHKVKKRKVDVQQSEPSSGGTHRDSDLPYSQSPTSMNNDDVISCAAIDGPSPMLLEQNAKALQQISENCNAMKLYENVNIIAQTRNNIVAILNDRAYDILKQKGMPPLNIKLNDELAHSIVFQPYSF